MKDFEGIKDIEGVLYLSYNWLETNAYCRISPKSTSNWTLRDIGNQKTVNGRKYIQYETIPAPTRSKLPSKLELEQLCQTQKHDKALESLIKLMRKACQNALIDNKEKCKEIFETEIEIQKGATKMSLAEFCITNHKKYGTKMLFKAYDYLFPNKYENEHSFYVNFINKAKKEGIESVVIHGNKDNKSALKFNEVHQAICIEIYKLAQKHDMYRVWLDYKEICKAKSLEPCTYSTVKSFLGRDDIQMLVENARHGTKYQTNDGKNRPFAKRAKPNESLVLVCGDGWFPGRSVIRLVYDKKQDEWVKKNGTMCVWLWFDWFSGAVLAYEIKPSESADLLRTSFANIMVLHGDVCPRAVLIDKKHQQNPFTKALFERAGVQVLEKKPYNPKENPAERLQKELNKLFRQFDENWVNISNNNQNFKHNPEHVSKASAMDETEFRDLIANLINAYNLDKIDKNKSRMEVLKENMPEKPYKIDFQERIRIFGNNTIVTINNGFVRFQIGTKKHVYLIESVHEIIGKTAKYNKVRVCFDERFMDSVFVFGFENENEPQKDWFICEAIKAPEFNPSPVEQTEDDKKVIGLYDRQAKAFDKHNEQKLKEYQEILENNDLLQPIQAVGQNRYKEALSNEVAGFYNQTLNENKVNNRFSKDISINDFQRINVTQLDDIEPV
jgi:hypothetical protein